MSSKKKPKTELVHDYRPAPPGEQPAPADWPETYTAFYAAHPAPTLSVEKSLARIERHIEDIKAGRADHEDDDGHDLGRLEYLRGPAGQHDRRLRWNLGLGTIGGEGGLKA